MRLLAQISRVPRWYWSSGFGLALVAVVVVFIVLNANGRTATETTPNLEESEPSIVVPPSLPATEPLVLLDGSPKLPPLDFPPGSVEAECGFNDLPPYFAEGRQEFNSRFNAERVLVVLESEECRIALENHINGINPYLWRATDENRQFAFIALENPLTFERVFADPTGDLVRVQDAMSRPECLLEQGTTSNWELKESCHADAFMNYALINRYCFDGEIKGRRRTVYWTPTPEQDRFMWKQTLEDAWVKEKCEALDQTLELTEHHPKLTEVLMTMAESKTQEPEKKYLENWIGPRYQVSVFLIPTIIELAARLGDDAAGLTQPFESINSLEEEGYKYGRFGALLSSRDSRELAMKKAPSTERFLKTFNMLAEVDTRKSIKFDWKWVAQHLCTPPYDKDPGAKESEESVEPKSCRTVVNEIYRQGITSPSLLEAMAKFEQVAMDLNVYD